MNAVSRPLYGGQRPSGGLLRRFATTPKDEPTSRSKAALAPDHPAVKEGRTLFPTRVFEPADRDRVLIDGFNNSKIGRFVTKGPWRGFPIYTLSLEERATCPTSCHLWNECYGNALPVAVRFRYGPDLIAALNRDLRRLSKEHAGGFVVRLHVLGDFPELTYVGEWAAWLHSIRNLHVWGYTAHPADSEIGAAVARMNVMFPGRWAFRHSVPPETAAAPNQASTIWTKAEGGKPDVGLICPAETGRTQTCGTCALCWSPNMADTRIVFMGHGMNGGVRKQAPPSVGKPVLPARPVAAPPAAPSDDFAETLIRERDRLLAMVRHIDALLELQVSISSRGVMPMKAAPVAPTPPPPKAVTRTRKGVSTKPGDRRRKENQSPERRAICAANMQRARATLLAKRLVADQAEPVSSAPAPVLPVPSLPPSKLSRADVLTRIGSIGGRS